MPRSPQWMDLYQIWFRGSPRGHNQSCRILLQSAHGFRFCEGSKFAISHRLGRSPLTQCWRYCAACDRDLEMWVRSNSRSLKLVPLESLGVVSYSPSIVTMAVSVAVCEIFNVKEWRDLENQVRGRSRSY